LGSFEKFCLTYLGVIIGLGISLITLRINILYGIMLIIPHGIIELPTICFVLSGKYFLIEEKDRDKKNKLFLKIIGIATFFLTIAAYIEAYYTLKIASMFL
jgi:uncharacterized membrane protein SpoIIM required for sporulation